MIHNLEAYAAQKRSTLDRVTTTFANMYGAAIRQQTRVLEAQIASALRAGSRAIAPAEAHPDALRRVFVWHQSETIRVGVSDGIREMSPEKKLSTWQDYPIGYPIEMTFTSLAERRLRDRIAGHITGKISKRSRRWLDRLLNRSRKSYLDTVKNVFREVSRFHDDKEKDVEAATKNALKEILRKTDNEAERIFRTETTRYFNEARQIYFKDHTQTDFVQLISVVDGRTSEICECRDMYVLPMGRAHEKQFTPPFHPNCRTIQSPLDTDVRADRAEVKRNLGREFGRVESRTTGETYTGIRATPHVQLPKGWG